jgi:hypothetical protein
MRKKVEIFLKENFGPERAIPEGEDGKYTFGELIYLSIELPCPVTASLTRSY